MTCVLFLLRGYELSLPLKNVFFLVEVHVALFLITRECLYLEVFLSFAELVVRTYQWKIGPAFNYRKHQTDFNGAQ